MCLICRNLDALPTRNIYIHGETNVTKTVTLNQPAILRCLAGGNPKPHVTWWRGNNMISLKSTRYEILPDYSLAINQVVLTDLGPYVCQAYNAATKAVSLYVTLKAYGPVHTRNPDDQQYLQYLVAPAQVPTTPKPDPRQIYRPVKPPPRIIPKPDVPIHVDPPRQQHGKNFAFWFFVL